MMLNNEVSKIDVSIIWNEFEHIKISDGEVVMYLNVDKIKNFEIYGDRRIVMFKTAKNLVLQLAYPTKQNINRAENNIK